MGVTSGLLKNLLTLPTINGIILTCQRKKDLDPLSTGKTFGKQSCGVRL